MLVLPRGVLVPSELKFCCLPSELLEVEHAVVHRGAHLEALHHRLRTPPHTVHSPTYIRIQPWRNTAHRTPRTVHRNFHRAPHTAHSRTVPVVSCRACSRAGTAYRAPIVPTAPAAALPPDPLATHCRHLLQTLMLSGRASSLSVGFSSPRECSALSTGTPARDGGVRGRSVEYTSVVRHEACTVW